MGIASRSSAAVQTTRTAEEDPVMVPEPRTQPDEEARGGPNHGTNPIQPRAGEGRE